METYYDIYQLNNFIYDLLFEYDFDPKNVLEIMTRDKYKLHIKNAIKGDPTSQYYIANFYNDGEYIPKNEEKGFYWNRKAAIYGIPIAQYNLAEYYLENPINKDESKAFKWYLKLANENKLRAIYLVAKCHRDGIGTDKNSKEATKWIEKFISNYYGNIHIPITLKDFLNGSDINIKLLVSIYEPEK
ncbi:hypothetical protein C1645_735045 [Glomus cerebriforme]|uniref:Sel1 repeat protein n=1 Tax=Glomus cerebriforme TaxID=658196 RepID=A0A397T9S0_9GLOM|nr:hypothetical protein C1645_735045 [Glomus cerebriforme]